MNKFLTRLKDYLEDLDAEELHYQIEGMQLRMILHPTRHQHFDAFVKGWYREGL